MNSEKRKAVLSFIRNYRKVTVIISHRQWRLVHETGRTNKRKNDDKDLNGLIGAAPFQMVRFQVAEQIEIWLSNRRNEFKDLVHRSCLSDDNKTWFAYFEQLAVSGDIVDPKSGEITWREDAQIRALARTIWHHVSRRHRKPDICGGYTRELTIMLLFVTIVLLFVEEQNNNASHADYWVHLRFSRHEKAFVPLHSNAAHRGHAQDRCRPKLSGVIQFVTGEPGLTVRLISDVTDIYKESRFNYRAQTEVIGLWLIYCFC